MLKFRLYILTVLFTGISFGEHVNLLDISLGVNNFLDSKNRLQSHQISNIETVYNEENALFHLFNLNPQGFILISADDRAIPILGWSFENNFTLNDVPSNVNWLITKFKTQINAIIEENQPRSPDIQAEWDQLISGNFNREDTRDVSPLLSSQFDQSGGWNNALTSAIGFNGPVGCVAVSMAQIMHYWGYPYTGQGSNYYMEDDYGLIEVDFSTAYYDFDNMAATYATSASQLLLFHSGVSVNMDYDNSGSGAYVVGSYPSALYSMENFFLYSDDVHTAWKDNLGTTEFRNIIQEQLDNGLPVIYSGYDSGYGGHAWNVDGYSGNNLHCNWGWGGWNNGYFNLTSMGGFSYDQVALVDLIPEPLTDPMALFEYEIMENTVVFIDLSSEINTSNITQWNWNFGDGNVETSFSPYAEHTYDSPGEYNVSLYVTNEWGQSGQSHFEQIQIGSILPGDINQDSVVNILDVVQMVNFIIGNSMPDESQIYAGDINGDGILNVLDIVVIVNSILDTL